MRSCELASDATPGPFQLQAAIHVVHCHAKSFETTDWGQIVALYDHLYAIVPTPVIAMNRAIAVGEVDGPSAALDSLNAIAPDLDHYHLWHAARGALLSRQHDRDAAIVAYQRAADLAPTETDRRFLRQRLDDLSSEPTGPPVQGSPT